MIDIELIDSLDAEQILHLLQRADARLQECKNSLARSVTDMKNQAQEISDLKSLNGGLKEALEHAQELLGSRDRTIENLKEQLREERGYLTLDAVKSAIAMWDGADTNPADMLDGVITSPEHRRVFIQMMDEVADRQKINAIKALRTLTGCGLKEGKEIVEGITV